MKGGKASFLILLFIGLLILVTDQTTNLFKYGFERLRPCHNEEIVDITMTMGTTGLERMGELEIAVVLVVGGRERDTQRNIAVESIENTLMADRTLDSTVEDIRLSRVETVTTGESAPFASCRMIFTTEYCYQLNNT